MDKHTPTPWEIANTAIGETVIFRKNDGYCITDSIDPENAAFIVLACNVHYELLAFVKDIRSLLGNDPEATLHKQADILIVKAEGK